MGVERRVWRYQRGNRNPYIEEEQTTQWPKEKAQKDKQQYTPLIVLCYLCLWVSIKGMVFNTTFNNISIISWRPVLLVL